VRCQRGHNLCFASELAKDYSAAEGGREKLVPIREGDDWGFPCCATRGLNYLNIDPSHDCAKPTPENVGVIIGDTPWDIECGKVIGANTIAVATGSFSVEQLRTHTPTAVFADFNDTEAFLRAIDVA